MPEHFSLPATPASSAISASSAIPASPEIPALPEIPASLAIPASPAIPASLAIAASPTVPVSPDIPVETPEEPRLSRAERRGKGARKQPNRDGKVHDSGRASVPAAKHMNYRRG
ncbi:hypothetical protein ACWELJ_17305 [Nocardia sp. NPDC004582]